MSIRILMGVAAAALTLHPLTATADDVFAKRVECLDRYFQQPNAMGTFGFRKVGNETFVNYKLLRNGEAHFQVITPEGVFAFKKVSSGREEVRAPGGAKFIVALTETGGQKGLLIIHDSHASDPKLVLGDNEREKGGAGENMLSAKLKLSVDAKRIIKEFDADLIEPGARARARVDELTDDLKDLEPVRKEFGKKLDEDEAREKKELEAEIRSRKKDLRDAQADLKKFTSKEYLASRASDLRDEYGDKLKSCEGVADVQAAYDEIKQHLDPKAAQKDDAALDQVEVKKGAHSK